MGSQIVLEDSNNHKVSITPKDGAAGARTVTIPDNVPDLDTVNTFGGALNVPAGASGTQVPQVQEVVKKSGDTMTGNLTGPRFKSQDGSTSGLILDKSISTSYSGIKWTVADAEKMLWYTVNDGSNDFIMRSGGGSDPYYTRIKLPYGQSAVEFPAMPTVGSKAIIASGSAGGSSYTKFSDGTIIMSGYFYFTSSTTNTITYPVQLTGGASGLSAQLYGTSTSLNVAMNWHSTDVKLGFQVIVPSIPMEGQWTAIGKWF